MSKANTVREEAGQPVLLHIGYPSGPRKEPRQARSIAMVNALRETGRRILETEGREALTVFNLSESAGVASSSIYEYFPSMDALIALIFDDLRQEAREELLAGLAALPACAQLYDGLLFSIRLGLRVHRQRMRLAPGFSVRSAQHDELVRLDLIKSQQVWSACVAPALLERFPEEVRIRDTEKALFLAFQTLLVLPRAMVLERPGYLDDDTAELIARMVHALLTTPA